MQVDIDIGYFECKLEIKKKKPNEPKKKKKKSSFEND